MSTAQVKQRILQTMNFVDREFVQGFHFVYPADSARSSACASGAVAYVWRASYTATTGYQETTGPKCSSGANAFTTNCGLDQSGKYYVYLCSVWMQQSEEYQTGVLVHEAAHHAGPNDVTGSLVAMQGNSQYDQLTNAANYENFAKTVVSGGCEDEDANCPHYASYCSSENIKATCKRTCGQCSADTSGGSAGGGAQGGTSCADQDVNCRYYTSYCSTENIKASCKQTCGLCDSTSGSSDAPSSGSSGGTSQAGTECTDLDGNCRYYTSYCDRDNVKTQCRKTCGLCASGTSSGSSGSPSQPACMDTFGSCQWYKDNNYCESANVRTQCQQTCGYCR